jgi:type II secretory pathway component PulK
MRRARCQYRRDGFILIVVLGAILALSALLFGFHQATCRSLAAADSIWRTEQLRHCAWAGLQVAVAAVRDANDPCQDPRFSKLLTGENRFAIGDASCSVSMTEENGLLNVNRLKNTDGQLDRRRIDQFLRLIDLLNRERGQAERIGYGIVPAVIDWTDGDDEVTCLAFVRQENLGAENDYYETQNPPGLCRNEPVDMVDELLEVKGITPENWRRLRPFLTCVGDGKININAAPQLVLESLSEQVDAALAQMIVKQRKLKPFANTAELKTVPGMTDKVFQSLKDAITVNPAERYYRVTAQGNAGQRQCTIEALIRRNTQAASVDILLYHEL